MLTYNWSGTVNGCDCTYRTESRRNNKLQFIYNTSYDGLNKVTNTTNLDDEYNDEIQDTTYKIE
jgi:hypothetical protein